MPRKKTGERIQWRPQMGTWVGRVRGCPAGVPRGRWLSLGTNDQAVAQRRYDDWLATGEPPKEAREETFAEVAERIVAALPERSDTERKKKKDRLTRLRTYAFPVLGHLEAWRVEGSHIASVLDRMPGLGKRKGTIGYVRTDLSQVLAKLVREGARTDNPARGYALPAEAVEEGRLYVVPTDDEICRFQSFGFETDLDIAVLLCRGLAGQRTSDLLAGCWEHVDWAARRMAVRRPKTDAEGKLVKKRRIKSYELVRHGIPDDVFGPLEAYWKREGSPAAGPMFPVRKSVRAGAVKRKDGSIVQRRAAVLGAVKAKNGAGWVKQLRREFWRRKIYRPLPGWDPARPQKEHCAFQTDTEESRALVFHSLRRAFVTALKDAEVPLADILALAGHTQLATSSKYDAARHVQVPDAALPRPKKSSLPSDSFSEKTGAGRAPILPEPPRAPAAGVDTPPVNPAASPDLTAVLAQLAELQKMLTAPRSTPSDSVPERHARTVGSSNDPERGSYGPGPLALDTANTSESFVEPTGIEPVTCALRTHRKGVSEAQLLERTSAVSPHQTPSDGGSTHFLGRSIAEAAERGDWELVEELTALAKRRSAAPVAPVLKPSDARKRRD